MPKLREEIDTDDKLATEDRPTRYKTRRNRFPLHCDMCGELYYVDEEILREVNLAIKGDPSENPFCCDECEDRYQEEGYSR